MKRRIAIFAAVAAIVLSGALANQATSTTAQAKEIAPPVQPNGSTWS